MAKILQNVNISPLESRNKTESNPECVQVDPESMKREAFEEGKLSGYEQGYKEGQIAGASALEQDLAEDISYFKQTAKRLLDTIQQEINNAKKLQAQEIAGIVMHIISQLFLQRQVSEVWVLEQVNRVLSTLSHEQRVMLYLHPQDIQRMQKQKISLNAAHLDALKICADEGLSLGGARIKTNHGEFDLSVDRQLSRLKELLADIQKGTIHG